MPVYFYSTTGPYGCFSNFSRHSFTLDGLRWPTSEHYFQAQKFTGTEYAEKSGSPARPNRLPRLDAAVPSRFAPTGKTSKKRSCGAPYCANLKPTPNYKKFCFQPGGGSDRKLATRLLLGLRQGWHRAEPSRPDPDGNPNHPARPAARRLTVSDTHRLKTNLAFLTSSPGPSPNGEGEKSAWFESPLRMERDLGVR